MTKIKKDNKRGTFFFVLSAGFNEDGKRRQILKGQALNPRRRLNRSYMK
jgi:hypothetical protein